MTFGEDQDPSNAGRKGGASPSKIRNKALSKMMQERWQNQEYRKNALKQLEKARENIDKTKAGEKSRKYENKKANQIEKEYDYFVNPVIVCDRIGIKDGKLIFIEIKRKGQKLRTKQKEFKELLEKLGIAHYEIAYV